MAGLGHMKGEIEATLISHSKKFGSTARKLHFVPPKTIANWSVTGRTVGDRRVPKVIQPYESNPPSDRSSRFEGMGAVADDDLPNWMVRNAASVMLIGTDTSQRRRPASALPFRPRSGGQPPEISSIGTGTASPKAGPSPRPSPASSLRAMVHAGTAPEISSTPQAARREPPGSAALRFLSAEDAERPVSAEGRMGGSRPASARSPHHSSSSREGGRASASGMRPGNQGVYGMSLLIPAMLNTEGVVTADQLVESMRGHSDWIGGGIGDEGSRNQPTTGDAGRKDDDVLAMSMNIGRAPGEGRERPQSAPVSRTRPRAVSRKREDKTAGTASAVHGWAGRVDLAETARHEAGRARRLLSDSRIGGGLRGGDALALSMQLWQTFNAMGPNKHRVVTLERFERVKDRLPVPIQRSLEKGFASKASEKGFRFDRFIVCAAPHYQRLAGTLRGVEGAGH